MGLAAQGDNRERSLPEDVIQPFETGPEASCLEVLGREDVWISCVTCVSSLPVLDLRL